MEEWLLKASINQLRDFLRGRFQDIGPYAADTGARVPELPHTLPVALWQEADQALLNRLIQAVKSLLEEIPGNGWTPRAIEWLCFFIGRAQIKDPPVMGSLIGIARRGHWLRGTDDGPRCYVALLRTLLNLDWVAEPKFWLDLPAEVQKRFPGIVFRGLLGHDMQAAFAYLRRAAKDAKHARQIISVLGDIMDDATQRSQVIDQLCRALAELPPAVSAYLTKWFRIYEWGDLAAEAARPLPQPFHPSCSAIVDAGWKPELALSA
ncbi:MAG: hypothetical protein FJ290_15385 [Planctomycetes bacterium]|nr:hypothetical protein [Planctomycetota bacterium]